jgi:hypothetical protein
MQIKFLVGRSPKENPVIAQAALLEQWYNSIENNQIKFIKTATINFIDYDISDYPDQDKIKNAIIDSLDCSEEAFEDTYNAVAESTRIMELIITLEDYNYD